MPIKEEKLLELIKELKSNGYKVHRTGDPINGYASGEMTIRYKDRNGFHIVTEIDFSLPVDHEAEIKKMFGL